MRGRGRAEKNGGGKKRGNEKGGEGGEERGRGEEKQGERERKNYLTYFRCLAHTKYCCEHPAF